MIAPFESWIYWAGFFSMSVGNTIPIPHGFAKITSLADLQNCDLLLARRDHVVILGAFVGYDYAPINNWLAGQGYRTRSDTPLMRQFYNAGIIGEFER